MDNRISRRVVLPLCFLSRTRFRPLLLPLTVICVLMFAASRLPARDLELIRGVEAQPLKAQVERVIQALKYLGSPVNDEQTHALNQAMHNADSAQAVSAIQELLDPLVLVAVHINPESRVKAQAGPANKILMEQGWTAFLVKVHNQGGVTAPLIVDSPQARPIYHYSANKKEPAPRITLADAQRQWADLKMFDSRPLIEHLSGLSLEYRIIQIYSRDPGKREASFSFDVGQGTQDLGFRSEVPILFDCRPAVKVKLNVVDHDGTPTTGSFVFRDGQDRIYPLRSKRVAPDFFFQDQVYRQDGEHVLLPPGDYRATYQRGPEYKRLTRTISVSNKPEHTETFRLERWIKMADHGWYSGDHHVHAAGCAHYDSPTQGVSPDDMLRHIVGEDLNIGCVLTWGPCWYYQKEFFRGRQDVSRGNHLMRYDVEVSGFPSSHAGHLCLLNLQDDDYSYPQKVAFDWNYDDEEGHFEGTVTDRVGHWPSWDLPILQWGKEQGGVVGFAHSGWGLQLPDYLPDGSRQFWGNNPVDWPGKESDQLPDYALPRFDGIGANEYIVDVVHDACDFISAVDTPSIWELNIWYHTLNCGYTCRISGETDFPCIYGDRVGLGRVYVDLEDQPLSYESWIAGIRDGRSYCSDGLSHLFDFHINGLGLGRKGADGRASVLAIEKDDTLDIRVNAAAFLESEPREDIRARRLSEKPYWHVERARVDDSKKVPVELIVNGHAVARQEIEADGEIHELEFNYTPAISSWIALRIFPSSHTNPIFVEVDHKPIHPSRRSAEWCLQAVDVCWERKRGQIRDHERDAAAAAYEVARQAYRRIRDASFDDRSK